jgi:hypothetical protein
MGLPNSQSKNGPACADDAGKASCDSTHAAPNTNTRSELDDMILLRMESSATEQA